MKRCSKCKELKSFDEFYRRSDSKDGLRGACKTCSGKNEYYSLNRDAILAKKKKHRELNLERYSERDRLRYLNNRETILDRNKHYIKENPWARKNASLAYRARLISNVGYVPPNYWDILIEIFGDRCLNPSCPHEITRENPLSLDHVIPLSLGGMHDIDNFQILCMRCNSSKQARIIDFRRLKLKRVQKKH